MDYQDEEDDVRRIRENLLGASQGAKQSNSKMVSESALQRDAELEEGLRSLGLNRREREQWRGRRNAPRPRRDDKTYAVKRLRFYLDERVNWNETTANRDEVAAAWARLCDYNVEKTLQWWKLGVDPLDVDTLTRLVGEGFHPADLFVEIRGKTVSQYLKDGNSMEWCLLALDWAGRRGSAWGISNETRDFRA
ncbi:hypothetical protein [Actinoplanes sp. NBRC 103695]|uniref:hypothetical protein n=1 Tax=Actinoplanes sp. NBRC 103695 TaxID=3032202 RepID=UPI0024A514E9|nr:hypothetical protein [Actinoplanes sp. NBRC 103695]GLZ01617.1 hypothetical protein Acsp02_88680 [Actinoplanes sp. NBRC 103695]